MTISDKAINETTHKMDNEIKLNFVNQTFVHYFTSTRIMYN